MSAVGRNDAFSVVGGMPAARFVQGRISRVAGAQAFVTCPTFDAGAEFGPVRYDGARPPVGVDCVVAVMTGTTEAWLVSWDEPRPSAPIYSVATPLNPVDGQEWIYPTGQEGVVWRFRYNPANVSAYKWEFIGGSAIHAYDDPLRTTVSTAPAALGGDPTMPALPWFGVYEVQWDIRQYGDNTSQSIQTWLYVVGVGATYVIDKFQAGVTTMATQESRTATLSLQPGWVMSLRHNVSYGTGAFQYRHLCLKPIYVQG